MIISEKQIMQLLQVANLYLRCLEGMERMGPEFLTKCGANNISYVGMLVQEIANQQPSELKNIE